MKLSNSGSSLVHLRLTVSLKVIHQVQLVPYQMRLNQNGRTGFRKKSSLVSCFHP
ncbi:hypothetical protein RHSIM_Rhsim04G0127500 [Rhododendron simsii]|uniref:Uncharacterized protein n=1 Tax=Rhododendron simsii TaxID=118357 RepID=A0A834H095_RHOSS|nr:hypothetical protein RHSIM_Rhsim04G0127500 [Rhododendron simsii]